MKPYLIPVLVFLIVIPSGAGTVYYVDATNGNDGNNGQASANEGGGVGPWQSLGRLELHDNDVGFGPGDAIYLKCGDIWRENLVLDSGKSAGTVRQPIIIGSYGNGAFPVISGADPVTDWSAVSAAGEGGHDDLETGELSDWWDARVNVSVEAYGGGNPYGFNNGKIPGGGTYGVKFDAGSYARRDLQGQVDEIWVSLLVRTPYGTAGALPDCYCFSLTGVSDAIDVKLRQDDTEDSKYVLGISGTEGGDYAATGLKLFRNTWYHLTCHFQREINGNDGVCEIWINGANYLSITDANDLGDEDYEKLYWKSRTDFSDATLWSDNLSYETGNDYVPLSCYAAACGTSRRITHGGYSILIDGEEYKGVAKPYRDMLITQGDWYIDEIRDRVYYVSTDTPADVEVSNIYSFRSIGLYITGGTKHLRVENIKVQGTANPAVYLSHCSDITLNQMIVTCSGYGGVGIFSGSSGVCRNLVVQNCAISHCYHAGIYLNEHPSGQSNPDNVLIRSNTIRSVYRQGIAIESHTNSCVVHHNIISDVRYDDHFEPGEAMQGRGIFLEGDNDTLVCHIYNNTVVDCEEMCLYCEVSDDTAYRRIENNIFYQSEAVPVAFITKYTTGQTLLDYNCYFSDDPNNTIIKAYDTNYTRSTFSDYQNSGYWGRHSVPENPLFRDIGQLDFRVDNENLLKMSAPDARGQKFYIGAVGPDDDIEQNADINGDGVVNLLDLAILGKQWLRDDR